MTDHVAFEIRDHIGIISLNKPSKLNAIDYEMAEAIARHADRVRGDRDIRAVVLRGEGRAFCAGADIGMAPDRVTGRSPAEVVRNYYERFRLIHERYHVLAQLPQPVIAALHGHCIGAGVELAMMADIRVAVPDTHFALPEVRLGIAPDIGGDLRLAREVGAGWAKRLLLTGDDFDGDQAWRIGLVHDLAPAGELDAVAFALAERIAANAPLAVQAAKRQVNFYAEQGMTEALQFAAASAAMCNVSDDRQSGFAARAARTEPEFKGY